MPAIPWRPVFLGAGIFLGLSGLIGLDVVWRAREAYHEGEKCWRAGDYKGASAWYETAAELYRPPESRWSRMARAKLPEAQARWAAESGGDASAVRVPD